MKSKELVDGGNGDALNLCGLGVTVIETLICACDDLSGSHIHPGLLIDLRCVSDVFGENDVVYVGETDRPVRLHYCRHHAAFVVSSDCSRHSLVIAGQGSICVLVLFELFHRRLRLFAFSPNVEPPHSLGNQIPFWLRLLIFSTVLSHPPFLWLSTPRCGYQSP